jgi:ribonuclease P protein component
MTKKTYSFPRAATIQGNGAFTRVMEHRIREVKGPLVAHAAANARAQWRLGISIGRRVGNAAVRNRIKRLLRESFRLSRKSWPGGYGLVVIVRPHEPRSLDEYQTILAALAFKLHRQWDALTPKLSNLVKPNA